MVRRQDRRRVALLARRYKMLITMDCGCQRIFLKPWPLMGEHIYCTACESPVIVKGVESC